MVGSSKLLPKFKHRLVSGRHLNSNETHHRNSSCNLSLLQIPLHMFRQIFACHAQV
jgi:hypothetical protein